MVAHALKKLAKEHNLDVSNGFAYGNFHGYAAAFYEGAGTKTMAISTKINNAEVEQRLTDALDAQQLDLQKHFRVIDLQLLELVIVVVFHDNPGTMKKMYSFFDWFFPILDQCSASRYGDCSSCGQPLGADASWTLLNGIPVCLHDSCAKRIEQHAHLEMQQEKDADTGNYASGFAGALIGALLGGIVWALVLYIGYYAAIVGFLIGILAKKGYELFHGKKGKGKLPIILLVVIIGVVGGTFLSDIFTLFSMVNSGELYGLSYGDVFPLFTEILKDVEYISASIRSIGAGLFFALLGIIDIIIKIVRENKTFKMKKLK